jgi:hypothetical protein
VPAAARGGLEPQAALLWLLAAEQTEEVAVDLLDQLARQPRRAERVRPAQGRAGLI